MVHHSVDQNTEVPFMEPSQFQLIANLGQISEYQPGQPIIRKSDLNDEVHILLDGQAYCRADDQLPWVGPGGIVGELTFATRQARCRDVIAADGGPVVTWSLSRQRVDELIASGQYPETLHHFLAALSAYMEARYAAVLHHSAHGQLSCDFEHPSIRAAATALVRKSPFETACAIWSFVREFPYRFGQWGIPASDTLESGYGMCTTKSNLQVALMRAAGLDASFCRIDVDGSLYASLMPSWYAARMKSKVKHYMATVFIDGQQVVLDSSYTTSLTRFLASTFHREDLYSYVQKGPMHIGHFNFLALIGAVSTEIIPCRDISAAGSKHSIYALDNFYVMNFKLDQIQGVRADHGGLSRLSRQLLCQGDTEFSINTLLVRMAIQAERISALLKAEDTHVRTVALAANTTRLTNSVDSATTTAFAVDFPPHRNDFRGKKVLVTAGGTREPIDPVRFISNRSSGKQGHAIADEAASRGADVTLVTTTHQPLSSSVAVITVETAADMETALSKHAEQADVIVMAAAVADFRPSSTAPRKLSKSDGVPEIVLEPTPDILARLGERRQPGQVLVGFAAETHDLRERAAGKLRRKGIDLIVANDVSRPEIGFCSDNNEVLILGLDGFERRVAFSGKRAVARAVLDAVAELHCCKEAFATAGEAQHAPSH